MASNSFNNYTINTGSGPVGMKMPRSAMTIGLRGFLCECASQNYEKNCLAEAYTILGKYADILYGPQDMMQKPGHSYLPPRFKFIQSGDKQNMFIKTSIEDPVPLAHMIVKDIQESNNRDMKYITNLIPIQVTCQATPENIRDHLKVLLERHLLECKSTFTQVEIKHNSKLSKGKLLNLIGQLKSKLQVNSSCNFSIPDICIIVSVIQNMAFLSIVPEFIRYQKFNLVGYVKLNNYDIKESYKMEMLDPYIKEETENVESQIVLKENSNIVTSEELLNEVKIEIKEETEIIC